MRHILGLVAISGLMACGGQLVEPIPDGPVRPGPGPVTTTVTPPPNPPSPAYPTYPSYPPYPSSPVPYDPGGPQTPPDPGPPWTPEPPPPPFPGLPGELPTPSYVEGVAGGSACMRMPVGLSVASELHVIGVYEPAGKDIDVEVLASPSPITLFLSSYEAVRWHVHMQPGAKVERAYVSSYHPTDSTVDGTPFTPAVTLFGGVLTAGCSYGWEPDRSTGGCEFTETIGRVRHELGAIETSFQGAYSGKRFTVPYGSAPDGDGVQGYDMRQTCTTRCTSSPGELTWQSTFPGSDVAISGLTAKTSSTSTWGAQLRATRGASCGRHYFEVDVHGSATVGARYKMTDDHYPLSYPWNAATTSLKNQRVGVALDLEAGTIQFVGNGGSSEPRSLGLWSFGEVVPAVDLDGSTPGSATMIVAEPFAFTPPPGFSAGF